jgi:hypothetical protein
MMSIYPRPMLVLMWGLVVCIPVGLGLTFASSPLVQAIGYTLCLWWMLGFVLWTLTVHARQRWPHLTFSQRLGLMIPDADAALHHDALARETSDIGDGVPPEWTERGQVHCDPITRRPVDR